MSKIIYGDFSLKSAGRALFFIVFIESEEMINSKKP